MWGAIAPWLQENQDGTYFCNLCGKHATDGHINSEPRQTALKYDKDYMWYPTDYKKVTPYWDQWLVETQPPQMLELPGLPGPPPPPPGIAADNIDTLQAKVEALEAKVKELEARIDSLTLHCTQSKSSGSDSSWTQVTVTQ